MEEESSLLRVVKSYDWGLRLILYTILKILVFVTFTLFILYLPLGDPDQQCSEMSLKTGSSFGYNHNTETYAYIMCNAYRAISLTALHTGNIVQKTVQFTNCVVRNVLYDIKLKFYSLLEKVDRQDLCRSICCTDSGIRNEVIRQRNKVLDIENKQAEVAMDWSYLPKNCQPMGSQSSEEFHDIPTQTEERRRAFCKCRGKCCRPKKI